MPGGAIVVVMTRWSKLDLTGQIVNQMVKNDDVDHWEVVEFPAILEDKEGKKYPYGQSSGVLRSYKPDVQRLTYDIGTLSTYKTQYQKKGH